MTVRGFERRVVADRNGEFRLPIFEPVGAVVEEAEGGGGGGPIGGLFGAPTGEDASGIESTISLNRQAPLTWSRPSIPVSTYSGGIRLSTSFLALLLALVVYTASFIAEIVRAGVQAVAKGQREAAQALGLSGYQIFTLVVFPQALRIIMPPMISQYLNLTKNSSLAPLAGYAELFVISSIIANQTGASIPMALLLVASYLVISVTFALVLNSVNERLKLVER
jgi:general L-amino acid transport system permease protein